MGKTILFLNKLNEYWLEKIEELKGEFLDSTFITYKDTENLRSLSPQANGVVIGDISNEEVENAKNLEIIFGPWTGIDFLNKGTLKKRRIVLANTHGNSKAVAEHTVSLSLALLGRIVEYHNDLERGLWHGFTKGSPKEDLWVSLMGKNCGILGLGNIGLQLAKILKNGFNCHIIGFKKHPTKEWYEFVDEINFDLSKVVQKSDIIFNVLPLTKETVNLLNWELLSQMKGKFLISVGRALIIDEHALYRAIKEGILAGAAIDVWYNYPKSRDEVALPSVYPIHTFKNVVISPHVGGFTVEGQTSMIDETIENIKSYLTVGVPLSKVDLDLEY